MSDDPYLEWLIENLKGEGRSQSGLARHLGIDAASVNRMVKGKRKLKTSEVPGAASYFQVAAPEIELTTSTSGLRSALVAGTVEAGNYREVSDIDDYGTRVEISVPSDDKFPSARLLAFDVSGNSMNDLRPRPILPGDRVLGVAYEDVAHVAPLRDGMVVVVQRTRDGGHMREWSIKQLEIYDDRQEFHPRSTDARHKPIIVPRNLQADDGTSVEIIALVRRVINDIPLS